MYIAYHLKVPTSLGDSCRDRRKICYECAHYLSTFRAIPVRRIFSPVYIRDFQHVDGILAIRSRQEFDAKGSMSTHAALTMARRHVYAVTPLVLGPGQEIAQIPVGGPGR